MGNNQSSDGYLTFFTTPFVAEFCCIVTHGSPYLGELFKCLALSNFGEALIVLQNMFQSTFGLLATHPLLFLLYYLLTCAIVGVYRGGPKYMVTWNCYTNLILWSWKSNDHWTKKVVDIAGYVFSLIGVQVFEFIKQMIWAAISPLYSIMEILEWFCNKTVAMKESILKEFQTFVANLKDQCNTSNSNPLKKFM